MIKSLWGDAVRSTIIIATFKNGIGKSEIENALATCERRKPEYNNYNNSYRVSAEDIVVDEGIKVANSLLASGKVEFADAEVFKFTNPQ